MKNIHFYPADAVQMLQDLQAKQAMGVHWGSVELTQEAFDDPPRDRATALQAQQLTLDKVWMMRHGETRVIEIPQS